MPGGRPSDYSDEVVERICEAIATTPKGIRRICEEDESLPHPATIMDWLGKHEAFSERYARAKEQQAELLAFRGLDTVEGALGFAISREDGPKVQAAGHVASHCRWMAERLAPKRWAETKRQEVSGPEGGPLRAEGKIDLSRLSDEEIAQLRGVVEKASGE